MNRIITFFALMVISTINMHAQSLTQNEIIGSWKVKEIIQQPENPDYAPIIKGFSKAIFTFKESGDFGFTTTSDSEIFAQVSSVFQNIKWKYDLEKQFLKMGNNEDHFSILTMYVKKIDDDLIFHLNESGIKFKMTSVVE